MGLDKVRLALGFALAAGIRIGFSKTYWSLRLTGQVYVVSGWEVDTRFQLLHVCCARLAINDPQEVSYELKLR